MKKIRIALILVPFILSGCGIIQVKTSNKKQVVIPEAGIFKSTNRGDLWQEKSFVFSVAGETKKISYGNLTVMKFDPHDKDALYLGSDNGIFYTYSRGEGWFHTLQNSGIVNDIAVDPSDKCTIYAAVHNKVYKSTDCARSWSLMHFSSIANQYYTSILVSRSDSLRIYVGTSDGTLINSRNGGGSWEVLRFFDSPVTRLLDSPKDVNVFYIVTPRFGIQRSDDSGATWTSLNDLSVHKASSDVMLNNQKLPVKLKDLPGTATYMDLKFDESQTEGLIYANSYGIFRLIHGEYWQEIEVLSKPSQAKIFAIAADTQEGKLLYFATTGALYRSENGGVDWTVRQLPAAGTPKVLLVAPDNANEVYIGFFAPPKKR